MTGCRCHSWAWGLVDVRTEPSLWNALVKKTPPPDWHHPRCPHKPRPAA